ncbi:UNKNOWN [Stylonychia lemnae]|uniref:Uncharacterized protein n=1 Tax=Stylonychia lemnae TaxID=5949 RepID=A0A078B7B1_STYLE|nr:UNKNOWN [Stylonychia lemnae]|eukprot:CDW89192.1 UNKNOWN [Stylonychia lemnae]
MKMNGKWDSQLYFGYVNIQLEKLVTLSQVSSKYGSVQGLIYMRDSILIYRQLGYLSKFDIQRQSVEEYIAKFNYKCEKIIMTQGLDEHSNEIRLYCRLNMVSGFKSKDFFSVIGIFDKDNKIQWNAQNMPNSISDIKFEQAIEMSANQTLLIDLQYTQSAKRIINVSSREFKINDVGLSYDETQKPKDADNIYYTRHFGDAILISRERQIIYFSHYGKVQINKK